MQTPPYSIPVLNGTPTSLFGEHGELGIEEASDRAAEFWIKHFGKTNGNE